MPTDSCIKCQTLPILNDSSSKLIIAFEVLELSKKFINYLEDGDMLFYLDRACRESSLKTAAIKNIRAKVFINFIPTSIYDPNHCLQSIRKIKF